MTDEQIIRKCISHLDIYRNISVGHVMKNVLNLNAEKKDLRRIRAKILDNPLYMEDVIADKDNFPRIRFNPNYEKLNWTKKYPVCFEFLKCGLTAIFSITVSLLLVNKPTQASKQINSQADSLKAVSAR